MKNFTKINFLKTSVLAVLFLPIFSNSAKAQQFTFEPIASNCSSGPMTTTLTITGINVTQITQQGFEFEVIFSSKNEFTGTATGSFDSYGVGFFGDPAFISWGAGVLFSIPMSSTTTTNLVLPGNFYSGSELVGITVGLHTDTAIIKRFQINMAYLLVESQCFAGFFEAQGIHLPVRLVSFETKKVNNNSLLKWTTAAEQNNKGYEIQRSSDSKNWSNIGFVKSAADFGNSSETINYSFLDQNPLQGVNFYRLKQVDFDGKFEFSEIRKVMFGQESAIAIYPNPAKSVLNISGLEANHHIQLSNITGQTIKTINSDKALTSVDISDIANGVYFVIIRNHTGLVKSFKFVKSN